MSNNTDMMGDDSDGAMRRATIVVCAYSGTEVPRYGAALRFGTALQRRTSQEKISGGDF